MAEPKSEAKNQKLEQLGPAKPKDEREDKLAYEKAKGEPKNEFEREKNQEGIFFKEEEKDGVKTRISSVVEKETEKPITTVPQYVNLRQSLDRVPGVLNLTEDGTLNNDRTVKLFDDPADYAEEVENGLFGGNPLPNRVGNELTNIENGFIAAETLDRSTRLTSMKSKLREMAKNMNEKDKKEMEEIANSI